MVPPAFADRSHAGRRLAAAMADEATPPAVVVGLARGGVIVAAEVAAAHGLPLDAVAVRKVGHPHDVEFALGAATPEGGLYLRDPGSAGHPDVARCIVRARAQATALDGLIHADRRPLSLAGAACLLVDDGLATGATMIAAVRWARSGGAARVVAGAPVAAAGTAEALAREADRVVVVVATRDLRAVGYWYRRFDQVGDEEVVRLLGGP